MPLIDGCYLLKEPFPHQLEEWRFSRDMLSRVIFWEQGTGKTKLIYDTAIWLAHRGEINALGVLAPNGVHRNWVTVEMPAHMSNGAVGMWWRSDKASTKKHQEEFEALLKHPGFVVLAMSYDALITDAGAKAMKRFLEARKAMYVADEAARIKNPDARRTKYALKSAKNLAKYRRVLNGTPVPNGPFDVYSQVRFADEEFWDRNGIFSFQGFKVQYGVWGKGYRYRPDGSKQEYPELIAYRNLPELYTTLQLISTRKTKEEVLDLPAKLYRKVEFDLSPAQRRVYDQLVDDSLAFLESGEMVATPLVLTKLLRLQQVTCGFVPVEDDPENPIRRVGDDNPRLETFSEIAEDIPHKCIVWTRFRADADLVLAELKRLDKVAVRYDGAVDEDGRAQAVESFNKGDAQFFVSNPAAGGEGLTLLGNQEDDALSAQTVIYYANSYNLHHRLQSEDRCHRIGQRRSVNYIDLVAADTIDEEVVGSLIEKFNIAGQITGDKLKQWLT